MSRYTVSYYSKSKKRHYMLEELNDQHIANAIRVLEARKAADLPLTFADEGHPEDTNSEAVLVALKQEAIAREESKGVQSSRPQG